MQSLTVIDGNSLSPGYAVFDGELDRVPRYVVVEFIYNNGWFMRVVLNSPTYVYYYDPSDDRLALSVVVSGLTYSIITTAGLSGIVSPSSYSTVNNLLKTDIQNLLEPLT